MNEDVNIPPIRPDGLQLEENRKFQERFWTFQRAGWVGFGVVVIAALLGLSGGGGVFHTRTVAFPDAVAEVPRIARWQTSDTLVIHATGAGDLTVGLGDSFAERFTVDAVQPPPDAAAATPQGQRLHFVAEGDGPRTVTADIRPRHYGLARFDLTVNGRTRAVDVFVLP